MSNFNPGSSPSHPLLESIQRSPLTAALLSKLVEQPANTANSGIRDTRQGAEVSYGEMLSTSLKLQREMQNGENALQLFPDIELSKQILITAIIAPNNMLSQELLYSIDHSMLPANVKGEIKRIVEDQVDKHYKLSDDLYKILSDALFDKGSHIKMVLPESAVDELINNRPNMRFESTKDVSLLFQRLNESPGLLGPFEQFTNGGTVRLESGHVSHMKDSSLYMDVEGKPKPIDHIEITDNFSLLKQAPLNEFAVERAIRAKFRAEKNRSQRPLQPRMESMTVSGISDSELKSALFKHSNPGVSLFLRVPDPDNLKRYSLGRPLYVDLPPECFIPVHYPGDPSRIVGGFALTDASGYFLTLESNRRVLESQQTHLNSVNSTASGTAGGNNTLSSSLLQKAKTNLSGGNDQVPLNYLAEIFGNIVDENIVRRIQNGVYGSEMAVSRNNDAYHVMLARQLAGQQTRMVYIPKQFFTYFAFQYNPNGTGRSLLTDVKYLISLRAVSLYAKVANQIRNAISVTDVNVQLDSKDPDPQKTLEKVKDVVSQTRTQFFPWGLNTPSDISNWWQRAGFQLNVEEHPRLPNTRIKYEFRNHDKGTPNIDDDDVLNDMVHMHFGITPEMRDASLGADFATSVVNSNIMFSKRAQRMQISFNAMLSDCARVIASNDSHISNSIRKVLEENWASIATQFDDKLKTIAEADQETCLSYFLDEVIDTIHVKLPAPKINRLKQQIEAFNDFVEALNSVFDAVMTKDSISLAFFGDASDKIITYVPVIKAQIIRDWMQNENFMPELFDLISTNEDGEPNSQLLANIPEHIKPLSKNIIKFIKEFLPEATAITEDLKTASGEEVPPADDPNTPADEQAGGDDTPAWDASGGNNWT